MKTHILAAAIALAATPAVAADVAEEIVVVDTAYNWSGVYLGVFGGWAHNRTKATDITGTDFNDNTPGATRSMTDDGFAGGVTAGYNFQNGSWVFGPEIELGWASNEKLEFAPDDDDEGLSTKYGFYGAIAGRVGFAADRTLFYAKGGLAMAQIENIAGDYDSGDPDTDDAAVGDKLRTGWTIGAGVEHAITDRWSIKGEYLYADFGSKTYDTPENTDEPFKFEDTLHTVKIGLNYQF